jgi:hypothetical protein
MHPPARPSLIPGCTQTGTGAYSVGADPGVGANKGGHAGPPLRRHIFLTAT